MRAPVLVVLALCGTACGDDTTSMQPDGAEDLTAGAVDLAAGRHHLHIRFDYRFDKAGFFTAERKLALEAAAATWGELITDDFPVVPAGTYLITRDPEMPAATAQPTMSTEDIDDLLVFVGSSELAGDSLGSSRPTVGLSGVADQALHDALDARFKGATFQPWTAWISFDLTQPWFFDPTPSDGSDVPSTQMDFMSVALHEMGHCLGIGTSDAFTALVDTKNHTFLGAHAVAAYGGPVPLTIDNGHIANDTLSEQKLVLMDPSRHAGLRYAPTKLDLAILQDLGYHL